MYKKIILLILLNLTLFASPAKPGLITFTQPDGSTFQGSLKGDSSFHWIESNGDVIIYNKEDKFYYKAIVDKNKGLISSGIKASSIIDSKRTPSLKPNQQQNISNEDMLNLKYLNKKAKSKHHPQ